jgi:hypothetical protein
MRNCICLRCSKHTIHYAKILLQQIKDYLGGKRFRRNPSPSQIYTKGALTGDVG